MLTLPQPLTSELRGLCRELDYSCDVARDAAHCAKAASTVSEWSVGDHLEHVMRADAGILQWLHKVAGGNEPDQSGRPTRVGYLVLLLGFIPRGRGKAPTWTRPERPRMDVIRDGLGEARESAHRLRGHVATLRNSPARMPHPLLGHFSAYQWVRFARIHHAHHRRIMDDIVSRCD